MERMLGQLLCITHNKEYIEYVVVYSLSSSVLLKDETVIWTHQTFFYDLPSIFLLAKRRLISRWFSSVILIMLLFFAKGVVLSTVYLPLQQEAFKQLCQVSRETRTSLLPLLLLTLLSLER